MGLTPKGEEDSAQTKKTSSLWKARVETRCLKKFTISDFIQITIQYRAVLYNKVFNFIFSVEEK